MLETTAVVIGAGATGMGTLRDLCMRGIPAILLEQGGYAHGTSSRFHGLLHSGARYAVNDPESARECIEENMILRRIARGCVELTEGLFILTPEDDAAYVEPWLEGCAKAGIDAREITPKEALRLEPNLSPDIIRAFRVPDSCIDGFRLVLHNSMSAKRHGGIVLNYHRLIAIHHKNGEISGVDAVSVHTGQKISIRCQIVVNAAGSWAGLVARLAGLNAMITPDRGTLIVFNHRFTSRVVNRLHASSDGDIFVPHGSVTILGTTSEPTSNPDDTVPKYDEVIRLLELGEPLFPAVRSYRILRAFSGTRPLYTPGDSSGRQASRNFHVVDHSDDGVAGLVSVFGGKLTTYRLMAEKAANEVCRLLGLTVPCRTADEPLVTESDPALLKKAKKYFSVPALGLMADRLGDDLPTVLQKAEQEEKAFVASRTEHFRDYAAGNPLLCECEMVSLAEIECVAKDPATHSLTDIRLRTRLGMGTCQGAFCTIRTIGTLVEHELFPEQSPVESICKFLRERWKGMRPALWKTQAREMSLCRIIYSGLLNIDGARHEQGK